MNLDEVKSLLGQLKENVSEVQSEWRSFHDELQQDKYLHNTRGTDHSCAKVKKTTLNKLQTEIKVLKENLPKIVNNDLLKTIVSEQKLHNELETSNKRSREAESMCQHWKARHESALAEYDQERKEKLGLKGELAQINQRVAMQSDYCAGMGAVCCTLLWRASQHEETIPALLVGSQMQHFMSVVCHTLDSFVATYQAEDIPSEQSEELQFVMALCGTITNIAASSCGREYLATSSTCSQLVQTCTSFLSTPSSKSLSKLKNLVLMALYNLSINQRGLHILTKTKGIVSLLVWLLQTEQHTDIRLHTLFLIQSFIIDSNNRTLLHEVKDLLSIDLLESLSVDTSPEIKEVTGEIIQVLNSLTKHEP